MGTPQYPNKHGSLTAPARALVCVSAFLNKTDEWSQQKRRASGPESSSERDALQLIGLLAFLLGLRAAEIDALSSIAKAAFLRIWAR